LLCTSTICLSVRFIDAELLQQETDKLDDGLTDFEKHCNTLKLNASVFHYDTGFAAYNYRSLMPNMFDDIANV
jgi:hypothetical protein